MKTLKCLANVPSDDAYVVSVKDLQTNLGMTYMEANGFIKFALRKGFAKEYGKRKFSGKGKPTTLYALSDRVQLSFYQEEKAVAA